MFQFRTDLVACVILFILGVMFFSRGLSVHGLEFRDDEIFYVKSTQEMVATGDVLSPKYFGEDRFQKPILFYWLILCAYKVFGVNWSAARFPAVVFASLTVCLTWLLAKNLFSRSVASFSVLILATIPLFLRHARNAVPDMALNFFVVWAIYNAVRHLQCLYGLFDREGRNPEKADFYSCLFFISCALGFMIKGYTAVIVPVLTLLAFSVTTGKKDGLVSMRFGRGLLIMAAIISPWFIYMALTHGKGYLDYMLVHETKNRILVEGNGNIFINTVTTFFKHMLFYARVIGSYFAPWSAIFIGALPFAVIKSGSVHGERESFRILITWLFAVLCFFSAIYFTINHYMLVLTVPFAILVSAFCFQRFDDSQAAGRCVSFLRKAAAMFIFTAGTFAYAFLFVFLAGGSQWWLIAILPVFGFLIVVQSRSRQPFAAPLCCAALLVFMFAQTPLLEKAGITSHAILQKFADAVHRDINGRENRAVIIGVGSHDIHEKEFQVYFDQRITKAAGSEYEETHARLSQLFSTNERVYCLLTEEDFNQHLKSGIVGPYEILREDYIIRRRMSLDKGFIGAIFRLDRPAIRGYMEEKLILLKKEEKA